MPVSSEPACHPEACKIQSCLQKNGFQQERCENVVRELYRCCAQFYREKGDGAESDSCPLPRVVRRKLEGSDKKQLRPTTQTQTVLLGPASSSRCSYLEVQTRLPFRYFSSKPASATQAFSCFNAASMTARTLSTAAAQVPSAPSSIRERFSLPQGPNAYQTSDARNEDKLKAVSRDFRSDTLTIPTDAMFEAMKQASRGDDVYLEDESTTAFEESIALLVQKEAAIFVSSGTLSNQLAIRAHLAGPPHQILLDVRAHINRYESGAAAALSGASSCTVHPSNGLHLRWEEDILPNLILDDDVHLAPTKLVCLENTLGGVVFPQEEIEKIAGKLREVGEGMGVKLHLDGARLWNVAAETGRSMADLAAPFDSVSLCLSKGLGAPMGTVLVGSKAFIHKVRHLRKMYGGGLRQTGPLVAAARVAIEEHFPRLKATHDMRQWLEDRLVEEGVRIESSGTNMIWFDLSPLGLHPDELSLACTQEKYLPSGALPVKTSGNRLVLHHQTDPSALVDLVEVLRRLKADPAGVREGRGSGSCGAGGGSVYRR
ncbi:hypothetical protein A4X06_0g4776 [Tilletia controversa]|uniref:Cx9C motif-containing protein 4, mitochondrial n=3 Tax=Tilletia TaxID=13289 RepID=A0A8X7SWH9_9BASI|nr:hypothetical protein A4X06_0g4776 [Tilletia controversa]